MSYSKRLMLAAILSVVLHVAILSPSGCWSTQEVMGWTSHRKPIVLNLQPAEPRGPRRLVETHTPADVPVEPTDLISDRDSKAQDLSEVEGTQAAPDFDDLDSATRVSEVPAEPAPAPESEPEPERLESAPKADDAAVALAEAGFLPEAPPAPELAPERVEFARAGQGFLPQTTPMPRPARSRIDGGVKRRGFIGFEAMEDEIAPYLLEIRRRVEAKWWAALTLRYSGTSPTKALLECAITPNGKLLYAEIVESGDSASFAPLCKEAIEQAGPFPPFPFKVPDVYRSKNLEITWTFNFLK